MKHAQMKKHVLNLALSAMFLAVGIVLPFFTGQIPQVGSMLLPMHLPVLLCGLICGWQYGGVVGFVLPLMRASMFGMPPMISAIAMAFEMAAYGGLAGFLYGRSKWKCVVALYRSLVIAMLGGRVVWGVARVLLTGAAGQAFTWQLFMAGAFLNAIPGIILQLVFIPAMMIALDRTGMVRFTRSRADARAARR